MDTKSNLIICQGFGRFKDELYKGLIHTVDNGTLPEHLTNQTATEEHYFHLTATREKKETNWQRYVASDILSPQQKEVTCDLVKNELSTMGGAMVLVCR